MIFSLPRIRKTGLSCMNAIRMLFGKNMRAEAVRFMSFPKRVPDLYSRLLEEEKQGNLVLQRYQDTSEYKELISHHIVDRLIRFQALHGDWEQDSRFATYFRPLIEGLLALMDGHLL